jgi:hypothetical protein
MPYEKPEDNRRMKLQPDGVIVGTPLAYRSFLDLKGCVLKEVDGNRLRLSRSGKTFDAYLHGWMDYVYLTDWKEGRGEKPCLPRGKNPLEFFLNRKLTYVSRYNFREDRGRELVVHLFLGVDSCRIPVDVMIYNDDGLTIDATPSQRNIGRIASNIMAKNPASWTEEDVRTMAYFKGVYSGETLKMINVFAPLTEEQFKESNPDAYGKILLTKAKQDKPASAR